MIKKTLSIFYDENCLPFKDASRETHFPLVGNTFNGSNNVTTIRFYVDRIGGTNNVTWLVVSKLPNGQIGNEVLDSNNAVYDSELGEYYLEFSLSSYYTTLKGDVYLSLNGYQGGVEVEQDSDTGIYSIYGTPTIQATGVVKIGINYAPQTIPGSHFNTSDLQQVLGALSGKANINNVFIVLNNISTSDLSSYDDGQLAYDKTTKKYYIINSGSSSEYILPYLSNQTLIGSTTIYGLLNTYGDNKVFGGYYDTDNVYFIGKIALGGSSLSPKYVYEFYVFDDTDILKLYKGETASQIANLGSVLGGSPTDIVAKNSQLANYYTKTETENKIDSAIADFLQKEYELVDTTTYPTLNDFLASTGQEGYIYLYPIDTTDLTKGYYQYIWENNAWLSLGTTQIDLSGYVPTSRTIAGIDLVDNITAQELTDALVLTNTTTDVSYILGD